MTGICRICSGHARSRVALMARRQNNTPVVLCLRPQSVSLAMSVWKTSGALETSIRGMTTEFQTACGMRAKERRPPIWLDDRPTAQSSERSPVTMSPASWLTHWIQSHHPARPPAGGAAPASSSISGVASSMSKSSPSPPFSSFPSLFRFFLALLPTASNFRWGMTSNRAFFQSRCPTQLSSISST